MGKQKILVIDDSSEMLALQKHILEGDNFEVITASSGKEALNVLCEIEHPDLIILDMQLEDMNGVDFLNQLEAKIPAIMDQVPVVILTGNDDAPVSQAVGFIKKFPDVPDFLSMVHKYIDQGNLAAFNAS